MLTDQLRARLGASVRLNARVEHVRHNGDRWSVSAGAGPDADLREYDAVLFAGTAHALAKLLISAGHVPDLAPLSQVYYPPVASVVLGFRREDVAHPLDGFGMLIPEMEKFNIAGHALLVVIVPGPRAGGTRAADQLPWGRPQSRSRVEGAGGDG